MKKFFFIIPIIFLIVATTFTKNSTKKLDKEIFEIKENIRALEDKYELALLDFNYLTSPKKLMEYQQSEMSQIVKECALYTFSKGMLFLTSF